MWEVAWPVILIIFRGHYRWMQKETTSGQKRRLHPYVFVLTLGIIKNLPPEHFKEAHKTQETLITKEDRNH